MRTIVGILIVLALFGCKKKQSVLDLGYSYVPLDSGITTVFQVRDIFHDQALVPAHDTNYYQIKLVISEAFIDDMGDTTYKIRRFYRENDQDAWAIKDVWNIKNTGQRIEVVEENLRLVDFVFAPSFDKAWDANLLNELPSKDSKFKLIHQPFTIGQYQFDSTCTVSHQNFTSFVDHNIEYDVFAKGVGKVYSVIKELTIDNFDTLDIKKGIEIEYRMIDYTK